MEPSVASQALGFAAFAALVLALLGLCAWLRHLSARSAVATETSAERCIDGQRCSVIGCAEPVQINLSVNHDYWPLCIGHGLPLLTEGMTR